MGRQKKEDTIIHSSEVQEDPVVTEEEALSKWNDDLQKLELVNEVFEDLERCMLHGSAEQMNQQQNELLTAKIKIKRLI